MPTLSETMTLAGFAARVTAGTLNIGQIYTISDKGWVLQAHSNTVAKPLNGALRMNNGDSLPEGVEPDEMQIRFNSVGTDNIVINYPGYIFAKEGICVDANGFDLSISIMNNDGYSDNYIGSFEFWDIPSIAAFRDYSNADVQAIKSEQIKLINLAAGITGVLKFIKIY